jgi:hypothetical protein
MREALEEGIVVIAQNISPIILLMAEPDSPRRRIYHAQTEPIPSLMAYPVSTEQQASNGQDAAQYTLGAHRDLEIDRVVNRAQISFNVPVGATSRAAHGRSELATTADRPGQEGSISLSAGCVLTDILLFLALVGRRPRQAPPIEITTHHATSAGHKLTRVLGLFR